MTFHPVMMALAALTVMLWLVWSDTTRVRRPMPILHAMRIALFLIVSGVLILNLVRYPHVFRGSARFIAIAAVIVGLVGAGYFARRLTTRR